MGAQPAPRGVGVYLDTPMPTMKDEDWRRTDFRELALDDLLLYMPAGLDAASEEDLPETLRSHITTGDDWGGLACKLIRK